MRTALCVLGCAGCIGTDDTGIDASITLLEPAEDATVCGTPLVVVTEVVGLELVDPYTEGGDPAEGTGHVDSSLNGQDAVMSGEESFEIPDVEEGAWQLKVELSGADHTAIEPYAGDFLYITVDATRCGS